MLVYTDSGNFYPHIKEKYVKDVVNYINNSLPKVFTIYGIKNIVTQIADNLNFKSRNFVDYYFMILKKNDFKPLNLNINGYICKKCNSEHFKLLKQLQYFYHQEEVYNDGSPYPFLAEMKSFKNLLDIRLNYAVFTENDEKIAVSKANVNGESQNCYQIGGIFTLKEFRNRSLSKFCLTNLIGEAFKIKEDVLLFVKKNNSPAINIYKQLGFKTLFDIRLYYF